MQDPYRAFLILKQKELQLSDKRRWNAVIFSSDTFWSLYTELIDIVPLGPAQLNWKTNVNNCRNN